MSYKNRLARPPSPYNSHAWGRDATLVETFCAKKMEEMRQELAVALGLSIEFVKTTPWNDLLEIVKRDREQLAGIKAIVNG